jgi:mannose-1-phosphate guanylyltransferase
VLGDTPKLLAPIRGKPYLAYLLSWLRVFGARRLVLALGYRAEAVVEYMCANPVADLEVEMVIEPQPMGTAGAIRFARSKLCSDPVLVLNGDSFVDADLCNFLAYHRTVGAPGSILCVEFDDAARYGRVQLDHSGKVKAFFEKDSNFHGPAIVSAGIYLLSGSLLDEIANGVAVSLERDIFERLPPSSLGAMAGRFSFVDIGTPESLADASEIFRTSLRDLPTCN